jgi:hypothetical protein
MVIIDKFEALRLAIRNSGLTQMQVAQRLSLNKDYFNKQINQKKLPDKTINKVLSIIDMTTVDFWESVSSQDDKRINIKSKAGPPPDRNVRELELKYQAALEEIKYLKKIISLLEKPKENIQSVDALQQLELTQTSTRHKSTGTRR